MPPYHDESGTLASSIFPPGEWWATTDHAILLIVAEEDGAGVMAVAFDGHRLVLDTQVGGFAVGEPGFVMYVTDSRHDSVWYLSPPKEAIEQSEGLPSGPAEDEIDRFVVTRVSGDLQELPVPFTLKRSSVCGVAGVPRPARAELNRLRQMLATRKADRG